MRLDSRRKDIEFVKSPRSVLHAELRLKHAPYPICRGGNKGRKTNTHTHTHTHTHTYFFFTQMFSFISKCLYFLSSYCDLIEKKGNINLEWDSTVMYGLLILFSQHTCVRCVARTLQTAVISYCNSLCDYQIDPRIIRFAKNIPVRFHFWLSIRVRLERLWKMGPDTLTIQTFCHNFELF